MVDNVVSAHPWIPVSSLVPGSWGITQPCCFITAMDRVSEEEKKKNKQTTQAQGQCLKLEGALPAMYTQVHSCITKGGTNVLRTTLGLPARALYSQHGSHGPSYGQSGPK